MYLLFPLGKKWINDFGPISHFMDSILAGRPIMLSMRLLICFASARCAGGLCSPSVPYTVSEVVGCSARRRQGRTAWLAVWFLVLARRPLQPQPRALELLCSRQAVLRQLPWPMAKAPPQTAETLHSRASGRLSVRARGAGGASVT